MLDAIDDEKEIACPEELRCPISHEALRDPVIAKDGHTYERENIKQWLKDHATSPLTNERLASKELLPNYTVRSLLRRLFGEADVETEAIKLTVPLAVPLAERSSRAMTRAAVLADAGLPELAKPSINAASLDSLIQIERMPKKTAAAILAHRMAHGDFQSMDELLNVYGVGAALHERLKSQFASF